MKKEMNKDFISVSERKYAATSMNSHNHNHLDKRTSTENVLSNLATEAARAAIAEGLPRSHSSPGLFNASSSSPALSYSLGKIEEVQGLARIGGTFLCSHIIFPFI